jgi:hypothetical protein
VEMLNYRIVEITSWSKRNAYLMVNVEFEIQGHRTDTNEWTTLGTSESLVEARKVLLFYVPEIHCGLS